MICCFAAFPFVFTNGQHIKVTLLTGKLSARVRGYVEIATSLIAFLFLILFIKLTYDFVYDSYLLDCHTYDARLYEVPWMAVMPLGGVVFALVVLAFFIERIWNAIKKTEIEEAAGIETEERIF